MAGTPVTPIATQQLAAKIAAELGVRTQQVEATIELFDGGATVPFVARYRKEATGGLDDIQLRNLDERLTYLRELEERRAVVLANIDEQGKLTDELRRKILAANTKTRLEDLYAPFKKKRRTKAQIARERGLEPLAKTLLDDPTQDPQTRAASFVDVAKEVADVDSALDGARQILIEDFAEDPELVGELREMTWQRCQIRTELAKPDKAEAGTKFSDWFDHFELLQNVPSHRALAFLRGRKDGILRLNVRLDPTDRDLANDSTGVCAGRVLERFGIREQGRPADGWLVETARLAWRIKISLHIETELMSRLRETAEREAIDVFARNLHDLLLAAPAGHKRILGIDPGLRTGCEVAVVDATGKVVDTTTIFPTPPRNDVERSLAVLEALVHKHDCELISIGNGTGSRETDRVAAQLVQRLQEKGVTVTKVVTNEAGASVYSASEAASNELPDLDVSLRGAVSIARRLQDPLAELVKIDPRSIGVGQYQHDVSQTRLNRALDGVVEHCVNAVGVDVNTASAALLTRVAGLTPAMAGNVVAHRDEHGAFESRKDILAVPRLGPKAFEQAAGFLRVPTGRDPLDASAVHPEAYPVVRRIEERTGRDVTSLLGDVAFLRSLSPAEYVDDRFGEPTVRDILSELEKPGRDPRPEWKTAILQDGVEELTDLRLGMQLEGTVTNVTNFGAFVDIGVHQDGLVHISRLSNDYVQDPREVVKAGQIVKVKVLEVDLARKRVALTMRMQDEPGQDPRGKRSSHDGQRGSSRRSDPPAEPRKQRRRAEPEVQNAFAKAFGLSKRSEN